MSHQQQLRRAIMASGSRAATPLDISNIIRWWDSTDIADGVDADAGDWTDRIAGAVATQVSAFKRNGEMWGSSRTLRGIAAGSALAYAPAAGWTLPGANVTVVHVLRAIAASQGYEWVCLCSGYNAAGNSHRQWGYLGGDNPPDYVGGKQWNKNEANTPIETRNPMGAGAGWGTRVLIANRAPTGNTVELHGYVNGTDSGTTNAAGYSGTNSGTDGGRIMGSGTGTQHGLYGYLRAILAFNGAISTADRQLLATYFGV